LDKQQLISAVVAAATITLTSAAHAGTIRYVDDDVPLLGDGLSWNTNSGSSLLRGVRH